MKKEKISDAKKLKSIIKTLKSEIKNIKNTTIQLNQVDDLWIYSTTRFSKNTGKQYKKVNVVDNDDVINMIKILNILTDRINPTTTYRQIVAILIAKHDMEMNIEAFNGGRNRCKMFFPKYYYPLKILHELGYVYYKNGEPLTRLEFVINPKLKK